MAEIKRYPNGLRLVVKRIDGLLSVSMGILVGAGAGIETDAEDGISHFIEHMTFKGTDLYTEEEISNEFDAIGAQQNAFTGKDLTCYYAKTISEHTERAFSLLSDLFLHSVYPKDGMEREKGVILEEIAMNEDTPEDFCLDLLSEAFYGRRNYGRNILGPAENVKKFDKRDIEAYRNALYCPENIVLSFAGNIDMETAERLVERYFVCDAGAYEKRVAKVALCADRVCRDKNIEQVHMAFAFPSFERYDPLMNAASVMNSALGGSMSSRLFQSVREKRGLAYNVYSYLNPYEGTGSQIVYAAVNPKNVERAVDAIFSTVEEVKKCGITKEELERGKAQIKASSIFAQESTSSQMLLYGKYLLYRDELFDFDAKMHEVDRVTMEDVEACLLKSFDRERMATAAVGKIKRAIE